MLQIRLLGQFDVRLDGRRVTIPSRAGQSLFAYLALTAGTPHRREKLAGIFWPDTSDENARKNLRQELWRIRKALSSQQSNALDYLQAEELTVAFSPDAEYWLDVTQMEGPNLDLESLTANLSLYQGGLLPGFYDDWVVLERERIQSIFDTKMDQLLGQLVAAERWTAAQEQAERWLSLGNVLEPAYRALMLAYGARGDIAKVSMIYQRCMDELDEKFGLEPSAETRALYDGLLKGAQIPSRPVALPSSTVTFLFTDIEESTNLLDKLGDEYPTVLVEHHAILRGAIQKWNGREVDTQGDAFFVTFARALDAVKCAAEAQRALASHRWAHGQSLRVRMGLHTGEPLIVDTGYVGMDVHRAARIGDAAHGGQVLLSQTTRELVQHDLPQGLNIRSLGEHRLKDLKFPTPIYQLVIDGLTNDFPPLRTKFTGTEAPIPGEPPFKGLQYFDEADSELFFGRELLTAKLVNRLRETRFLSVVIGASGSGKSSLVRAGLIPALKKGQALIDGTKPPEGSGDWQVHIITPTAHPLEALAIELTRDSESVISTTTLIDDLMQDPRSFALFLARRTQKQRTLLVIDQFEELFTLCRDEFEREAFIDNLLHAIANHEGAITAVITLRADFYAHLAQYPELRDAVARQQEYIGRMTTDELRRAIEEPAKRAHWAFESGLVDLILRDVGDEPGALPLLSHALLETWKRRAGHTLTLKGYADAGGVRGAIAHTAESVYQNLLQDEQAIAHDIFLRLTELGEGTEDTRRRASFDELTSNTENASEVRRVLNVLAEARLITLGEDTAEVAHEALIREWPTLREWLNQDRAGLQLHRRLTESTHEWELLERDAGALYRGANLAQAREWAALHPKGLNAGEKAFLEASNALEQNEIAEREAQRQRELEAAQKLAETERKSAMNLRNRNRVITTIGIVAIALAMLASMFGFSSSRNAERALNAQATAQIEAQNRATAEVNANNESNIAQHQSLMASVRELSSAANLNLDIDPERSILLALQAVTLTDKAGQPPLLEAQDALHRAVQASRVQATLHGHTSEIMGLAISPNGENIATIADDNTIKIWDFATGKELMSIPTGTLIPNVTRHLSFSPDGTRIASSASDNLAKVWNVTSGKELLTLRGHTDDVSAAIFSPNGKWIATSSADQTTKVWDSTTGQEVLTLKGQNDVVDDVAFSPDGKYIATAGDTTGAVLWDAASGKPLFTFPVFDGVYAVAFGPDGKTLATAAFNTTWSLWDVASSQKLLTQYGHASLVVDIAFDPSGKRIATTSEDGTAKIWDASTGRELFSLLGHESGVMGVAFSPDGNHIATASRDTTIRIWDVSPSAGSEWFNLVGDTDRVFDAVYSPDGKYIGAAGVDNKARVWDADTGKELVSFTTENSVWSVAFSPDGTRLFAGSSNLIDAGAIQEWDVTTHKELLKIPLDDSSGRLALSPDGLFLATGGLKGTVAIWDAQTGRELRTIDGHNGFIQYLTFSPDSTRLAVTSDDGLAKIWDVATGNQLVNLRVSTKPARSAFSPDGKLIATTGNDGMVIVWNSATGEKLYTLTGFAGATFGVAFSPDGKNLAASSVDRTVKIWNVADHFTSLPLTLYGHTRAIYSVAFSPDGKRILTASRDTTARVYALSIEDLIKIARSRLTRQLTTQECQQYLHVDTCPAMP